MEKNPLHFDLFALALHFCGLPSNSPAYHFSRQNNYDKALLNCVLCWGVCVSVCVLSYVFMSCPNPKIPFRVNSAVVSYVTHWGRVRDRARQFWTAWMVTTILDLRKRSLEEWWNINLFSYLFYFNHTNTYTRTRTHTQTNRYLSISCIRQP